MNTINWETFWRSLVLSLFVLLTCNSVSGLILMCRKLFKFACPSSCCEPVGAMMDVFEKMGRASDVIKYIFSAFFSTFDISRTDIKHARQFRREDNRNHQALRKFTVFGLGSLAIVIMLGEIFASAAFVNLLAYRTVETEMPLADMNLIKIGSRGRPIKDGTECTMSGVLIDDGTKIEGNTVTRQDVRLDTFGLFRNLHLAYTFADPTPIEAEFYEMRDNEIAIMLKNRHNLGIGYQMRPSITGVDGISRSYKVYEGTFGESLEIRPFLERVADFLDLTIINLTYTDVSTYTGSFGIYTAQLAEPFSNLERIMNSISNIKCKMFMVGRITNSTSNNDIVIKTSQTTIQEFPDWFWVALAIVACIALISGIISMLDFDDTEMLVILSRYIKGDDNCLASPITDLSKRVELGFTCLGSDPEPRMCYGYVDEHRTETSLYVRGIIGGHVELDTSPQVPVASPENNEPVPATVTEEQPEDTSKTDEEDSISDYAKGGHHTPVKSF